MDNLETQVAKIQFGNPKAVNAHVFMLAEKAFNNTTELYVITELPLMNPAATEDCERITKAIAASLKRSYRKAVGPETFENALAQINEELGKLASLGQTYWIGKLNGLIAVKDDQDFSIATTGKISALLFRENDFTNIADNSPATHPLKTFENFAVGKVRLHDIVILSTNQLFNHVSIDRIKNILVEHSLPLAGQQIMQILQDNAGPETAFGTLLILQAEPGTVPQEQIALEDYVAPDRETASFWKTIQHQGTYFLKKGFSSSKTLGTKIISSAKNPATGNFDVRGMFKKNKQQLLSFGATAKNTFHPDTFQKFSRQKKIFFVSSIVLVVALIANIGITSYYKKIKQEQTEIQSQVEEISKLITDANSAFLYQDPLQANEFLLLARTKIENLKSNKDLAEPLAELQKQSDELAVKIEKRVTVKAEAIATLSTAENLIVLPNIFATQTNGTLISYNTATEKTEDNTLISAEPIKDSIYNTKDTAIVYNGERLYVWNYKTSTLGTGFSDQVPAGNSAVGLSRYATNNRVYTIDTKTDRVISFIATEKDLGKPLVSLQNAGDLSTSLDLTIDGNLYILSPAGVSKFQSGKPAEFNFPSLATPLSAKGKIYTDSSAKNIYILDIGNKRIIILNKTGALQQILECPDLTNAKDFTVNEASKTIFVLNDSSLLKISF